MKELPEQFVARLKQILPPQLFNGVMESFLNPRPLSVRINTLKAQITKVRDSLSKKNISFKLVEGLEFALILENISKEELNELDLIKEGLLYQQSLSSMLVAKLLDPQPQERCLDLCAAPGSKTSLMSSLMNNDGEIIALDSVKERFYKLKSVLNILGVKNVQVKLTDGRKFKSDGLFDKILVDAPCSSEGRFHLSQPKTFSYWSERKIKEMAHKQKGLLLNAARYLKKGGRIIYATCTFAPEENEGVLHWFLKKNQGHFICEPIKTMAGLRTYPTVLEWKEKVYNPQIANAIRILPDDHFDAFFIAQLKKII